MSYVADLDAPLLKISRSDHFTLRDAVQGVSVMGGTGSGKTSATGKALASAYLRAGFGGIICVAKPDETQMWLELARANGRANSVIVFGEHGGGGFNFLTYELTRQGPDGLGSVVECLMRILEAAHLAKANPGRGSEPFWEDTSRQLLRNTIPVLYAATGAVRIPDIIRFVSSAPTSAAQLHDADWQNRAFLFHALLAAERVVAELGPRAPLSRDEFDKIADYWEQEYAQLDPKTRSNIAISLSTALDRFNRGRLNRLFCGETTVVPELTFHGAIIILDMPALTWNEDGVIGQQLFKYMWQRAVLARNALEPRHRDRPVFLWADEAHHFLASSDADYQSTCRSSRACTVFLSQSLPTYYAKMAGENAKARAEMLLANFATRVWHNSSCAETNRWASETIGRSVQRRGTYSEGESYGRSAGMGTSGGTSYGRSSSYGSSTDGHGNGSSNSGGGSNWGSNDGWNRSRGTNSSDTVSSGYSETMDFEIEPGDFGRYLVTGGPANGGKVTAVWFQAGKQFRASQRNYLHVSFRQ